MAVLFVLSFTRVCFTGHGWMAALEKQPVTTSNKSKSEMSTSTSNTKSLCQPNLIKPRKRDHPVHAQVKLGVYRELKFNFKYNPPLPLPPSPNGIYHSILQELEYREHNSNKKHPDTYVCKSEAKVSTLYDYC